jgi:hypothetical protein
LMNWPLWNCQFHELAKICTAFIKWHVLFLPISPTSRCYKRGMMYNLT